MVPAKAVRRHPASIWGAGRLMVSLSHKSGEGGWVNGTNGFASLVQNCSPLNVKFGLDFVSGTPTHPHIHTISFYLICHLMYFGCKAVSFDESKTVLISLNCFS